MTVLNLPNSGFPDQSVCANGVAFQLSSNTEGGTWSGTGVSESGVFDPNGVAPGTYELSHTVTNAEGCTTSSTGEVTVFDIPDPTFEDQSFCADEPSIQLTANTAGGVWTGSGISLDGIFDPASVNPGTYQITYVVGNENNCSTSYTGSVEVRPVPDSSFPEQFVCTNSDFTQLMATTNGGTWSGDNVSPDGMFEPMDLEVGSYELTYSVTNNQGCSSTSMGLVTIVDTLDSAFPPQSLCENEGPMELIASVPGGVWAGPYVSQDGLFDPTGLAAGTYEVSYIVTNSQCTNGSLGYVTVLGTPNADFPDQAICIDSDPVELETLTPGGTWSGEGINEAGNFDPSGLEAGTYEVSYTITNEDGCSNSSTGNVEVIALLDTEFTPQDFCSYNEPTALVANTDGGTWSGEGIDENGVFDPSIGAGTYDITYTLGNENDCSNSTTQSITVFDEPDASFDAPTFCEGQGIEMLEATMEGGTWSGEGVDENGVFDTDLGAGTYTISYTIGGNGDCSASSTQDIVVNPLPDSSFEAANFCVDAEASNLVVTTDGGMWMGLGIDENGLFDPSIGAGTYDIEYTVTTEEGCSTTTTQTIEVYDLPDSVFEPLNFCISDEPGSFTVNTDGGTWSGTGIDEEGIFDPSIGEGTYEITYTIEDENGCSSTTTETVEVYDLPDASFEPATFCYEGDASQLFASQEGGTWSGEGIDEEGIFDPSGLEAGEYEITYTIEDDNGCSNSTSSIIVIYNEIVMLDMSNPICIGTSDQFETTIVLAGNSGPFEVTWTSSTGTQTLTDLAEDTPINISDIGDESTYTLSVTETSTGCTNSFEFTAPSCPICAPEAGTLPEGPITLCGGDELALTSEGADISTVDTLVYVVHSNETFATDEIVMANGSGNFNPEMDALAYNTIYYISAVAALVDEDGNVIYDGLCVDISDPIEVLFLQPLEIAYQVDCEEETGIFSVTYLITGGLPSYDLATAYTISGDLTFDEEDGMGDGTMLIQDYTDGNNISLTVTDAQGCSFSIAEGPVSCSKCGTEAGVISQEPIIACADAVVQAEATDFAQFGLPLVYMVHTDTLNPPGEILVVKPYTSEGVFEFADLDGGAYNGEYFISAYIGQLDENGFPDFETVDNCTVFMPGPMVVWLEPLTIFAEPVCDFGTGTYDLLVNAFGGWPSYDPTMSYNVNINDGELIGSFGDNEVYVSDAIDSPSSYTVSVNDNAACAANTSGGTIECAIGLAIELMDFGGKATTAGNNLYWTVASEYDHKHYLLERSTDARTFEPIATINGLGNTNTARTYTHLDKTAGNGTTYYRLQMVDLLDGVEYSHTIALQRNETDISINNIYPIPTTDQLTIDLDAPISNQNIDLVLYDLTGKEAFRQTSELVQGNNQIALKLNQLATGVYLLQIQSEESILHQRIVID